MTVPKRHLWRSASARTRAVALAVGVLHVAYALLFQWATRERPLSGFDPLYAVAMLGVQYLVMGFGLLLAGALPVVLWARRRLISPALALAGWLAWSAYGYWTMRGRLPLTSFTPYQVLEFRPYPDYILRAIPLLVVLVAVAAVELALRRGVRAVAAGS